MLKLKLSGVFDVRAATRERLQHKRMPYKRSALHHLDHACG